jgi:hypothetical protein
MSNTNEPKLPTPSQALDMLINAVEFAQSKGVYSIQDAVLIAASINVLRELHPQEEQPATEENAEAASKK